MGKLLLFLSMLSLVFLFVCSVVAPNSSVMWLASGSGLFQFLRLVLGFILGVQFVTNPPRNLFFRVTTAVIALSVGTWAIQSTYNYQMQFADTLAFLIASLAIGITSLEYRPREVGNKFNKRAAA